MLKLSSLKTPVPTRYELDLAKRQRGPQRHRLLQGYPLPPLMVPYDRARGYEPVRLDQSRPLIVGVLPHASCNPTVQGCGYCTFPHEEFRAAEVRETVRSVVREIADFRPAFDALRSAGLVEWDYSEVRLTERGMFFADSVAGLLAGDRVGQIRQGFRPSLDDAPIFRMG